MLIAALSLTALLQQPPPPPTAPTPGVVWRSDLEAARADALASGRPLLVVFRCEP